MAEPRFHASSLCRSSKVGENSTIGAFCYIDADAVIGNNCTVADYVSMDANARMGDGVTVHRGVHLYSGITLEDNVVVGPNCTFMNQDENGNLLGTVVHEGAFLGAHCTILPGLTIGAGAMVGAGAVVTRPVPPGAKVVGNPGRIIGYVNAPPFAATAKTADGLPAESSKPKVEDTAVPGVVYYRFPRFKDMRGSLSVGEFESQVPFLPQRYFVVFRVNHKEIRGEHAHRACHQFLICLAGSVNVLVDDGKSRQEIILNRPDIGLYLPPMIWGTQYNYSADASLLVFASHKYDPDDYIRNYHEFLDEVSSTNEPKRALKKAA